MSQCLAVNVSQPPDAQEAVGESSDNLETAVGTAEKNNV
jgi:hypothetical protein